MTAEAKREKFDFQTEVREVLNIVINSLYSNKEIFLRELISNASDAADKLKLAAYSNTELYEDDPDLKVWIEYDKEKRTITIKDNGIGMTKEDLEKFLEIMIKENRVKKEGDKYSAVKNVKREE